MEIILILDLFLSYSILSTWATEKEQKMKNSPLLRAGLFFGAVYTASGLLYYFIIRSGQGMELPTNKVLMAVIAFTPSIFGIVFTYLTKNAEERKDFWRRTWRWPSGHTKVAVVSLIIFPIMIVLSYTIASWFEGNFTPLEYAGKIFTNKSALLQFLLVEFLFGAISEELGWRGYVLDELQSRWKAIPSSLVLGIVWAIWHTPAFVIPGLSQNEMGGIFSWNYLGFVLMVVLVSVIHTWSYNNTGRSILVAGILMHFFSNATIIFLGGIFDQFSMPHLYYAVLPFAAIIVIGVIVNQTTPATLTPRAAMGKA